MVSEELKQAKTQIRKKKKILNGNEKESLKSSRIERKGIGDGEGRKGENICELQRPKVKTYPSKESFSCHRRFSHPIYSYTDDKLSSPTEIIQRENRAQHCSSPLSNSNTYNGQFKPPDIDNCPLNTTTSYKGQLNPSNTEGCPLNNLSMDCCPLNKTTSNNGPLIPHNTDHCPLELSATNNGQLNPSNSENFHMFSSNTVNGPLSPTSTFNDPLNKSTTLHDPLNTASAEDCPRTCLDNCSLHSSCHLYLSKSARLSNYFSGIKDHHFNIMKNINIILLYSYNCMTLKLLKY